MTHSLHFYYTINPEWCQNTSTILGLSRRKTASDSRGIRQAHGCRLTCRGNSSSPETLSFSKRKLRNYTPPRSQNSIPADKHFQVPYLHEISAMKRGCQEAGFVSFRRLVERGLMGRCSSSTTRFTGNDGPEVGQNHGGSQNKRCLFRIHIAAIVFNLLTDVTNTVTPLLTPLSRCSKIS